MDLKKTDSRRSYDRPATIAFTSDSVSMLPMSDILDWTDEEKNSMWNGYGLRRVRSWVTSTVQTGRLPALPSWLGIDGISNYIGPRIGLLSNPTGQKRNSISRERTNNSSSVSVCESCMHEQDKERYAQVHGQIVDVAHRRASLGDKPYGGFEGMAAVYEEKSSLVVVAEDKPRRQLMSMFQIPEYMVEDYIWGSYRPLSFSYGDCIKSWGYVHSELGNIMTHLFGSIIFIILAFITGPVIIPMLSTRPGEQKAKAADYIIVYVYLVAVLFCLTASTAFHTLSCHSHRKHFRSLRCDFIGILTLIVGSFVPIGYYGFLHSRKILIGYMVMFVVIGMAGVAVSVVGRVEDPKRANWRPIIFMGIAGSGLVPIIHGAILNGYSGAVDRMSLWYVVGMGVLYISGTMLYAFKIPERWRPGKHDVFLQSHQIFHIFVVLAALCHYVGIIRAVDSAHRT